MVKTENTYQDGRVVLCKEELKALRKRLGASQEKVAFSCAEQGLCVSISSLKRAETNKNVLYRTARDLAKFYNVSVEQLCRTGDVAGAVGNSGIAKEGTIASYKMALQRNFVIFCCKQSEVGFPVAAEYSAVSSIVGHIAPQYNAEPVSCASGLVCYAFGVSHTYGNEAKRAIAFSNHCLQSLYSIFGTVDIFRLGLCVGNTTMRENELQIELGDIESNIEALISAATPGRITISEELLFAAGDNCELIKDELSGNSFWVVGDSEQTVRSNNSPIIGRRVELTIFNAVLESAREYKNFQLVHLLGVAGIGKSRLTEELVRVASLNGFNCHITNMLDFQVEQRKLTIPKLLSSILSIGESESNLSLDIINSRNDLLILQEMTHLPLLNTLLSWKIEKRWESLIAAMSPEKLFEYQSQLICRILSIKANVSPLLIVVEDYHWSQKSERAYLESIVNNLDNDSVVLLITTRPGEASESLVHSSETSGASVTNISLGPLSNLDAQHFAEHIAGNDEAYREKCIAKAQGNPLFLEQLLKDRRGSVREGLPYSLQSLIVSRIDDMPADDQLAVRAASVIGHHFTLGLLQNLLSVSAYDPAPLVSSSIVNGDGESYSFKHALIAEGIYQSISLEDRRSLHYRCAQWYTEDVVMQCQHLLKAEHPEALEKIVLAIRYLIKGYNFERAKDFVDIALNLPDNESTTLLLYELRADVHVRTGDIVEALSSFEEMYGRAVTAKDRANALIGKANCLNTLDKFDQAMETLEEAGEIANQSDLLHQLSSVHYLKGNFLFPKGKSDDCIEAQKTALFFARKANAPEFEARSLGGLGDAAYASGKMVTAYEYFRQCLELCEDHDLKAVSAANLFMMGTVRIYLNENEQALADVENSINTAQLVGHKRAEIVSRLTASWILADSLRVVEADSHVNLAMEIATEIGAQRFLPFLRECKSRCLWYSGKDAEAFESIQVALVEVEELNAEAFIGPWVLGSCALLSNTSEEAEKYLNRADVILKNGCVGHNYYRFYVAAIDTTIKHELYERTTHYISQFRSFTENEPCPWSDYYLKRGEILLGKSKSKINKNEIAKLVVSANSIQLKSSIALLENALKD